MKGKDYAQLVDLCVQAMNEEVDEVNDALSIVTAHLLNCRSLYSFQTFERISPSTTLPICTIAASDLTPKNCPCLVSDICSIFHKHLLNLEKRCGIKGVTRSARQSGNETVCRKGVWTNERCIGGRVASTTRIEICRISSAQQRIVRRFFLCSFWTSD